MKLFEPLTRRVVNLLTGMRNAGKLQGCTFLFLVGGAANSNLLK